MDFNRTILCGRLTRDPEVRHTAGGTKVGEFSLAVGHRYGQGEERKEKTSFFDCTAFGNTAAVVESYLRKGSLVLVEGRLEQQRWDDQQGQKRSKVVVIVDHLQLGPKQGGVGGQGSDPPNQYADNDDIAF